jgi:quinol monooxygenase YgiN
MPSSSVTLINVLKLESGSCQELVSLLKHNIENVICSLQGWKGTRLIAAADGHSVVIYSEWETLAAVEAMRADPRMQAYFPRISALASIDSVAGEEVFGQRP